MAAYEKNVPAWKEEILHVTGLLVNAFYSNYNPRADPCSILQSCNQFRTYITS